MNDFTTVDRAINSATRLAHLDSATIWAMVAMGLIVYVIYMLRQNKASDKEWQVVRAGEAKADAAMAEAVSRLADKIAQLQLILLTQKLGGSDVKGMDTKAS